MSMRRMWQPSMGPMNKGSIEVSGLAAIESLKTAI